MKKVVYELRSVPVQGSYLGVCGTQHGYTIFDDKRYIASLVNKGVVFNHIVKDFIYREVDKTL